MNKAVYRGRTQWKHREEMNTRMRSAVQVMKATPKHDKETGKEKEKTNVVAECSKLKESGKCLSRKERKIALQRDVDTLKKKLFWEENVHRALKRAFTRPLGALPRLPPYLPSYTLELLAEVAVLEEEVVRLEEQVVHFRQGLYQEAIYISSSKKITENGLDSIHDHCSPTPTNSEQHKAQSMRWSFEGNPHFPSKRFANGRNLPKKHSSFFAGEQRGKESHLNSNTKTPKKQSFTEEKEGANKLSEEILRCLLNIFARMSLPKNTIMAESEVSPSVSSSSESSEIEEFIDPYGICSEFGSRDIGPYKLIHELEASSVNTNLITNSLFLRQRLKLLLKKLESVDIAELSHQEKLAFWVNIYNSCMMNAFLENGIPSNPQMVVEQMLKAVVNVGGHLLSAMTIEHFILRLPYYSKHISLEGLGNDEKTTRTMFKLDWPEPLVTFALSCGSWSSPSVRVYTASQVQQQLEEAKRDYLQAAVGISKPNKLGIPKLLDWYLLDFASNMDSLVEWICMQLPVQLRNDAIECLDMSTTVFPLAIQVFPYQFRFSMHVGTNGELSVVNEAKKNEEITRKMISTIQKMY